MAREVAYLQRNIWSTAAKDLLLGVRDTTTYCDGIALQLTTLCHNRL